MTNAEVQLIKATERDSTEIWTMQKAAFTDLLIKYQDYETSPANEPLEKTITRLNQPFTYFYFIVENGKKVGAIRVVDKKSEGGLKHISPLFIMPEYRNRGYAQAAILKAEKIHGSNGWEIDTILQEPSNCHLYEKMGYHRTDKVKEANSKLTLIYYRK
ncbi:MAG: GNAT family N-acetyltransferase [Roseburia sp.]|nr:GNAT family N-acetyltransferase [Roseburia sp.]